MDDIPLRAQLEQVAGLVGADLDPPSVRQLLKRRRDRRQVQVAVTGAVVAIVVIATVATWLGGSTPRARGLTTPGVAVQPGHVSARELASYHWTTIPDAPISATRSYGAAAVWTGTRMLVWGGESEITGRVFGDGAAYDPTNKTWERLPASPLGPRVQSVYGWTGRQMFIWGGSAGGAGSTITTGATYNPTTRTWRRLPPLNVGTVSSAAAVWTGRDVVLFTAGAHGRSAAVHAYDPLANSWTALPSIEISQSELSYVQALQAGPTLYVWMDVQTSTAAGRAPGNAGFEYQPDTNSWKSTNLVPERPYGVGTPTWTGDHIVFAPAPIVCDCAGMPGSSTGTWADPSTGTVTSIPRWPYNGLLGANKFAWTGAAILALGPDAHAAAWNPNTRTWTRLPDSPYQGGTVEVWTGNSLIIWGQLYRPPNNTKTDVAPITEPSGMQLTH